jgi:hypothetical protein
MRTAVESCELQSFDLEGCRQYTSLPPRPCIAISDGCPYPMKKLDIAELEKAYNGV